MFDFELIKNNYLNLRGALINYLDKFVDDSYFYKPTNMSNAVAWIVPHIAAFEQVKVWDLIKNYEFNVIMPKDDTDKYEPGVNGYSFTKQELMTKKEAIKYLQAAQEVSVAFFDDIINKADSIRNVDMEFAFNRFMLNFGHETEHYGQLKYLLGTFNRTHKK